MSDQETKIEIETLSATADPVQIDEPEKLSSESILNDNSTEDEVKLNLPVPHNKTNTEVSKHEDISNECSESVPEVSASKLDTSITLLSKNEVAHSTSSETTSSENVINVSIVTPGTEEKLDLSSNRSISLLSSEQPCPQTEKCEKKTSSDRSDTKPVDSRDVKLKTKLVPVAKDLKTSSKIKVVITSLNKQIESLKDSEQTFSTIRLASDQIENSSLSSKSDVVPNDAQTQIESSSNETEKTQSTEQYAEHVTYTDDGTAIYIDPETQYKYKWSPEKNDWIAYEKNTNPTANVDDDSKKSNPYENEHYRWCSETNKWIPKYTEQTSSLTETEHYRWDAEKNEWIMKNQVPSLDDVTYGYEDGVRIYTDKDGTVFFWDTDKKAWFPKIDDDFMARYQMSYGFIDNTSTPAPAEDEMKNIELEKKAEELKKMDAPVGGVKRKAPPEPPKWFEVDPTQNTKVYVSNLPLDITLEEFSEIMSKCGMIMKDPQTQKQKLKLYTESDGQLKGDGLCDYIKVESVDLALKLLDESIIRGCKIKVQRAKFQMRGEYNPTLKPKKKKKDKEKLIKMKEKLFDWRPEKMRGERSKHERTVIIKNLFTPELFDKEVHLIIDYQNDLREECSKCGTVRKVVIYDRHVEGVAQVNMADPEQADLVIQMMNGRFFGQRKLTAESWDGKTKYKVAETEKEVQERINKWDKYLEKGEEKEADNDDDESSQEANKNQNEGNETED